MQLEQLQHPHRLGGGGHQAQLTAWVGQQHSGGRGIQQLHAAPGEQMEEVDHVEVGDHGVSQLDEGIGQLFPVHPLTS